ncbi:glyoxylase-like metal-dependent hydrolase (beta-lactamase superfamily II) [Natronospira proteinivora]|uniref:Glyoxylase-like metal-dependent hydrolase (Beta-lactamase superfamily II) n=1 Tax=Natronospira proteinivora TaxID=1807133 RepID=A0ABT1GA49_9GAMM|nr:MBL fold metallo-hydrolase [Natronospira proteinivora]MCP1728210.1 glyoxylase-like metal-dependent hydrolase (beta-lactamase superfamily II) [Natronospira proteinivora]
MSPVRPRLTQFPHGITAIDTDYHRPRFDASHLIVDEGRAAFVDTGTTHSVPALLAALAEMGLDRKSVDYVLLTHVHLDHAGGAGELMKYLPNAICIVHPRGARHMVDPAKLIAGTKAVYGEAAFQEMYGEIPLIPAERVRESKDGMVLRLGDRRLTLFHTPGHAKHHYCIFDDRPQAVFTGDTFGVSYRELDTDQGEFILPTTTPVHFDPQAYHQSVDRIMSFEPNACFLTHYSRVTDLDRLAEDLHREIDAFVAIARAHQGAEDRVSTIEQALIRHQAERMAAHGIKSPEETTRRVLDMDLQLDAQGLDVWLSQQEKQQA